MNIVFMGTPQFAVAGLQALLSSKHKVVGVFTQPDRRQGRGRKIEFSPVKQLAIQHGVAIYQPDKLNTDEYLDVFAAADVVIVIAYGLLLPKKYLDTPKYGCLNVHASLLPRWRGAAPIQRAVMAQDELTGVCLMQMDSGLDTGPVHSSLSYRIKSTDTSIEVADNLAVLSQTLLLEWLDQPSFNPVTQVDYGITYAHKLTKQEFYLDWHLAAVDIVARFKGLQPWPGVGFVYAGLTIKVSKLLAQAAVTAPAGTVVAVDKCGLLIAAKVGGVLIEALQLPGKKPQLWGDFYNGRPDFFQVGDKL